MTDRALVGNAADVQQVKKAKKYDRIREEHRKANLEATLRSPFGSATLCDILDDCGLYDDFYSPGNSEGTNRFLGRRSMGLKLFKDIEAIEPGAYGRMRAERNRYEQAFTVPKVDDTKQPHADTDTEETES